MDKDGVVQGLGPVNLPRGDEGRLRRVLEDPFSEAFVCEAPRQANAHFSRMRLLVPGGGLAELSVEFLSLFSLWRQLAYALSSAGACARLLRGKGGSADGGFYSGTVMARLAAAVF